MKHIFTIIVLVFSAYAIAQDHSHHVKHNMVMYGESEIFLSHLVYKVPHNYQVILKIELPTEVREHYLAEKKAHPEDRFIFLFDHMCIGDIAEAEYVVGEVFRKDALGNKIVLEASLKLTKENYKIIFFNELPTDLN